MVAGEGTNGFAVDLEVFDGLRSVYRGIGDGIRSADDLSSMAGAAGSGSEELSAALVELGGIVTEFLGRAGAANALEIDNLATTRARYGETEQSITKDLRSMEMQFSPQIGPTVAGRVDRVLGVRNGAR
jgi:hypothetical protein